MFTFYATTCAEKCNHQLVVATTGAFTLTSVMFGCMYVFMCFALFVLYVLKLHVRGIFVFVYMRESRKIFQRGPI